LGFSAGGIINATGTTVRYTEDMQDLHHGKARDYRRKFVVAVDAV